MNGVAFDIQTEDRFPAHTAYINALPPDNYKPEEFAITTLKPTSRGFRETRH